MKYPFFAIILLIFCSSCQAEHSKQEAEKIIQTWYSKHPKGYELNLNGKEIRVETADFNPSQVPAKHKLIRVYWEGMTIELCFNKALSSFNWTEKSLEDNLVYFSLTNIYSDIELNGWKVYPRTPMSALHDGEGIMFKKVDGNKIVMEIDWETYSVFGYAQNDFCQSQLQIADISMPQRCFVGVRKTLPLKILVDMEVRRDWK